ncbi:hypothetical protein N8703_01730 [Verrucomicrobia bacterium]|nr:hypothetical protein [Verrucomicrobiota bacterium]
MKTIIGVERKTPGHLSTKGSPPAGKGPERLPDVILWNLKKTDFGENIAPTKNSDHTLCD